MSLRERTRPGLGIIEPCLQSPAKAPPSGPGWIHEIKHDGFRILARRGPAGVQLITRAGNDFSHRFPFIAMAVSKLPVRSCLIDGEAIVCDTNGLAVFKLIRGHGSKASAVHLRLRLAGTRRKGFAATPDRGAKRPIGKTAPRFRLRSEHRTQQALRGGRRDCISRGLPARLRGHSEQTPRINLSRGPLASLAESQKSECASGKARGGGRLGAVNRGRDGRIAQNARALPHDAVFAQRAVAIRASDH